MKWDFTESHHHSVTVLVAFYVFTALVDLLQSASTILWSVLRKKNDGFCTHN